MPRTRGQGSPVPARGIGLQLRQFPGLDPERGQHVCIGQAAAWCGLVTGRLWDESGDGSDRPGERILSWFQPAEPGYRLGPQARQAPEDLPELLG